MRAEVDDDYAFISIHAPAKGATIVHYKVAQIVSFQSTLPRRERLTIAENCWRAWSYFNPRSREGSDDCCVHCTRRRDRDFNPRSREGSDPVR